MIRTVRVKYMNVSRKRVSCGVGEVRLQSCRELYHRAD